MEVKERIDRRDLNTDSSRGIFSSHKKLPDPEKPRPLPDEFEEWVVDFTGCDLLDAKDGKSGDSGPLAGLSCDLTAPAGETPVRIRRKRPGVWILVSAFILVCGAGAYLSFLDSYQAETKLLFVAPASSIARSGPWSVEQELEILKSSTLTHRVLNSPVVGTGNPGDVTQVSHPAPAPPDSVACGSNGNVDQLHEMLSFRVDRWDGGGCVTVCLRGDDPRALKSLLTAYTREYLQSRHELVTLTSIARGPTRPGERFSGHPDFVSVLDAELARMEFMKRNCELALKLMEKKSDKKKGSWGVFLPSGLGAELTSLNRINEELVNLSIKKQHLATRYHPASREIGEVNQEIEGLRLMMLRHLKQQVAFLSTGLEQLEARKREIRKEATPTCGQPEARGGKLLCGNGPDQGEWIPVSSDIVIMPGRPIVVKRPIRERFLSLIDSATNFLLDRPKSPRPTDPQNGTAPRLACTTTTLLEGPKSREDGRKVHTEPGLKESSRKQGLSAGPHK